MVTQSTSQVAQRAQEALTQSCHMGLRGLKVHSHDARLHISGRVATFYQKQQAQEIVRAAAANCIVVNEVEVN